jgi:hypothetical protein
MDKGKSTDIDKGKPTDVDKGKSTNVNTGKSTNVDKGKSTEVDKGKSTEVDKGKSTDVDKGEFTHDTLEEGLRKFRAFLRYKIGISRLLSGAVDIDKLMLREYTENIDRKISSSAIKDQLATIRPLLSGQQRVQFEFEDSSDDLALLGPYKYIVQVVQLAAFREPDDPDLGAAMWCWQQLCRLHERYPTDVDILISKFLSPNCNSSNIKQSNPKTGGPGRYHISIVLSPAKQSPSVLLPERSRTIRRDRQTRNSR